jgi:hypothetical protein
MRCQFAASEWRNRRRSEKNVPPGGVTRNL